jgi:hypothetical protein
MTQESTAGNRADDRGELAEAFGELEAFVQDAVREATPAHEVERGIFRRVLAIGRRALAHYLAAQGTGDLGETLTLSEGRTLRRLPRTQVRDYVSVFGPFRLERTVYGTRPGQKVELVPLDARLALPKSKFSYVLEDWDQMLATELPYGQVSRFLERILGLRQHVDSLERMSRRMAPDAESACWSLETPPADEEGEILVESADGKGVPIRRPADAPPVHDHQHRRGPKPDRKRIATVGAVYSVDRLRRTPEELVEALFHEPQAVQGDDLSQTPPPKRPRPRHKRVYAQLTCEDADGEVVQGLPAVFAWIDQQVRQRHAPGQPVVTLMDGQQSLWEMKALCQDDLETVEVLDLLHVTPRLWQAAHLFHPAGSRAAEDFVRTRVHKVLRGEVLSVVRGLRSLATRRRLSPSGRKRLGRICGYFERNRERMRYDEYLREGYPIASGVIEGACRHVVKDRLERTGMSWTKPGAQALLHLRSVAVSGQWAEFLQQRIEKATHRLYPGREALVAHGKWALTN